MHPVIVGAALGLCAAHQRLATGARRRTLGAVKPGARIERRGSDPDADHIENELDHKSHHDTGENREAEKLCIAILMRDPSNAQALLLAGSLARGDGDLGLALTFFKKVVALQPKAMEARLILASTCSDAGEHEDAIKHFVTEAVNESLRLEVALNSLRTEKVVVVLHYSPVVATVVGEPQEIYPFLGSSRLAETIDHFDVNVVFHGHAHHGSFEGKTTKGTPVYNCCLQLVQKINPDQPYALVTV